MKKGMVRLVRASIAFGAVMALEMINHGTQMMVSICIGLLTGVLFGGLFSLIFPMVYKYISKKK